MSGYECPIYQNCQECVRTPFDAHCKWDKVQHRCLDFFDFDEEFSIFDLVSSEPFCSYLGPSSPPPARPLSGPPTEPSQDECDLHRDCLECVQAPHDAHCDWNKVEKRCDDSVDRNKDFSIPDLVTTKMCPQNISPPPLPPPPPRPHSETAPLHPIPHAHCSIYKSCAQCLGASIDSDCHWHKEENICRSHFRNQLVAESEDELCPPEQVILHISVNKAVDIGAFFSIVCFIVFLIWRLKSGSGRRDRQQSVHDNMVLDKDDAVPVRQREGLETRDPDHHEIEMCSS